MEIKLTAAEIRDILKGCQQTLRLVRSTTEYRQIECSEFFSTTNNVVLGDAISALDEVLQGVEQYQLFTEKTCS